jgi:hypothetical protein
MGTDLSVCICIYLSQDTKLPTYDRDLLVCVCGLLSLLALKRPICVEQYSPGEHKEQYGITFQLAGLANSQV